MNSMIVRTVLGTIGGYAMIVLWTILTFTLWWFVLGPGMAFHPGTTEVTGAWLAGTLPLNLVGAILGGWAAAKLGGTIASRPAVISLLLVLLVLGLLLAIGQMGAEPPSVTAPTGDLGPFEAASAAVQPNWVAWVLPFLGALGVWIGGIFGHSRETPRG